MESELKMLDEKLKELRDQQNYKEMINVLRKHEAMAIEWYTQLSSTSELDPTINGIFLALEQISLSMTSLLRKCSNLLEDSEISISIESEPSTGIPVGDTSSRERDDTFTANILNGLIQNYPSHEVSKEETQELKFWYIISGKNESLEISVPQKEYFGESLTQVMEKIGIGLDEKFSVSPLGYEAILLPQMQNNVSTIVKSYGNEFTLIKLFS